MSKKRYPHSEAVAISNLEGEPSFITWDGTPEMAIASSKALAEYGGYRSPGSNYTSQFNDFSNMLPGISSRPGFTRSGYNYYRSEEGLLSKGHPEIIRRCNAIYKEVGLIRNMIDLMGDFASKGIRLTHRTPDVQDFFNNWFLKVSGPERSERLCNYLVRTANVIIKRQTAKVPVRTSDRLYKTSAAPDLTKDDIKKTLDVQKREIPWKYTFIDSSIVEIAGGPLASFVGKPSYVLHLPSALTRIIKSPKPEERSLVEQLPDDILKAAQTNKYILPPDKTIVLHYKKDDWETWATPILYSIFKDAIAYDKLKLADLAALDGAISNVRIFKLGSLEFKLLPTAAAAQRLSQILQSNTGGGTMDIIWGPDIELIESRSEIYKFLGQDKYIPTLNAIYAGLGIPPTLTGTFGAAGTTNNLVSLNTLVERLTYMRDVLVGFWTQEIALVQKAMGFQYPAEIEFDLMDLGNGDSIKKLYMDLADRSIISDETVQNIFGQNSKMEKVRLNREKKDRAKDRMVRKAGPYVEAEGTESLKKIALQAGLVSPSEVGLELEEKTPGQKNMMDHRTEQLKMAGDQKIAQQKMVKKAGGQGRPKNAKDSVKRKTKTFTPRSRAQLELWAYRAQSAISDFLTPGILKQYGKKTARQLTTVEAERVERIKFGVLSHIEPLTDINQNSIAAALNAGAINAEMWNLYYNDLKIVATDISTELSLDDMRRLQVTAYIDYYLDTKNEI